MKILVTVKPVIDVQLKIKTIDGKIDDSAGKIINAWDEHAIEAALQIKDSTDAEVVAVTVDKDNTDTYLRKALAMGANSALSIDYDNAMLNSFSFAQIIGKLFTEKKFDILLMGKQAQDYDSGQACHFVSHLFGIPCFSNLESIQYEAGSFTVKSMGADGSREIKTQPPAILTVSDGINRPRLAGLRNIMLAKKKSINKLTPADLSLTEGDLFNPDSLSSSEFQTFENNKSCQIFDGPPQKSVTALFQSLITEQALQ